MTQIVQTVQFQMYPDYLSNGLWSTPHSVATTSVRQLRHAGAKLSTLLSVYRWVCEWELWNIDMGPEFRTPEFSAAWLDTTYADWYQRGEALCQQLRQESGLDIEYAVESPDALKEQEYTDSCEG